MSNVLSLDSLASCHASRYSPEGSALHRRAAYNFKVTLFNMSTALLIVKVAGAVLGSCTLFSLFMTALVGMTRHAVQENMKKNPLRDDDRPQSVSWKSTKLKVLEFIVWKNWAPMQVPVQVPGQLSQQSVAIK
jgi:hypothetical protein